MPEAPYPVMLFAAGFGTRMKALTRDRPKPMIPVAGKPLVDHAIDIARAAGCDPIVANLHYKPDILEAHLEPQGVRTLIEAPEILETGGGLRNALPHLGATTVVTMNTDAVWKGPNPIRLLAEAWDPEKMDALLVCLPRDHAVGHAGRGDFVLSETGRILRGDGLIYGGVQIIKTEGLGEIEEQKFSLNVLWDRMLGQGRLFGIAYPGQWCDVGHPEGIALAEGMLKGGQDV